MGDFEDKKTAEQWRTKWKSMKSKYLSEKTAASKSGVPVSKWHLYEEMADLMQHRPCANSISQDMADVDNG